IGSLGAAYLAAGSKAQSTAKNEVADAIRMPIGSVVASMLTPAQMMQVAGDSWVPADGRKVSTQSPYAIETGSTELPDLRGVFARGLNQFDTTQPPREAKYLDPETRKLAAPQEDAFREHLHTVGAGTTDVGALSTGQVLLTAGKRMPSYY